MSDKHHEEGHTGPVKNSKQLLITVVLAFILPVILIIGLVNFVGSAPKRVRALACHGSPRHSAFKRLALEIRDANRPLRGGEDVYKGQCAACHATGVSGAPKFGDAAAWAPRLGQGFEVLVQSALKGKNAVRPKAVANSMIWRSSRAVALMANAGGANFPEPQPEAKEGDASKRLPIHQKRTLWVLFCMRDAWPCWRYNLCLGLLRAAHKTKTLRANLPLQHPPAARPQPLRHLPHAPRLGCAQLPARHRIRYTWP